MRNSPLWLKLAVAFAGTAIAGVLVAALLIQHATSSDFNHYLQSIDRMNQMMGGGHGGPMMGAQETAFLGSVRNSLWIAGGVAIVLACLIAVVLSRQITAPLRRLGAAANKVARGDTSCRVRPGSGDEVGRLTDNFNCMVESLDKNQEARRALMSDVAHEMSTPLAIMQGNLEGILDGLVEPSAANISSLREEAALLSRLVQDLRTLSQAESGKLEMVMAEGDIASTLSSIVTATEPQARRKQVSLLLNLEPGLPPVVMDSGRISQVVTNLLANALRYTSGGGSVTVSATTGKSETGQGRHLLVSVADTGRGISQTDLPHVFDRYYQGEQPREKRSAGSGIGLAVVKELVEAHKGKVWVESAQGEGSTFSFTLPLAP